MKKLGEKNHRMVGKKCMGAVMRKTGVFAMVTFALATQHCYEIY